MKRLLVYFALVAVVFGCTTIKYVPVKETEYVTVRDSVAVHDTTIAYQIEKEYIEKYSKDTLRLETNYSNFVAYQDTLSGLLSGKAWNKNKSVEIPTQWKEKIVYRDSVVTQEVPIEVVKEVKTTPRWAWYSLIFSIICVFGIAFYAYTHLKP